MPKALDLTGQTYGQLTVIRKMGVQQGHATWLCSCTCGGQHEARGTNLTTGVTTRCGSCSRKARMSSAESMGITIYEWTYIEERASLRGMVPHVCGFAVAVSLKGDGGIVAMSPFSQRPILPSERFIRARWVMGKLEDLKFVAPRGKTQSVPDWMGKQGVQYRPHPDTPQMDVWGHRYWATEGREWRGPDDMFKLGLTPEGNTWVPTGLQLMKLKREQQR